MYLFVVIMIVAACICAVVGNWFMVVVAIAVAVAVIGALIWDAVIDSRKILYGEDERARKAYGKRHGLPYAKTPRDSH